MPRTSILTQRLSDDPHFREGYGKAQSEIRIGIALRQLREAQYLTQKILAERAGMDQAEISKLETGRWGKRGISTDVLKRVLSVYGLQVTSQIRPLPGRSVTRTENEAISTITNLLSAI